MKAKQRYDKKMPILSVRVSNIEKVKIDRIVEERRKWQSGFNRQTYLYELISKDLRALEIK